MIKIGIYGLAGADTAQNLLNRHRQELGKRFSRLFIRDLEELGKYRTDVPEVSSPEVYIAAIGEGGLWAALWKACDDWKELHAEDRNVPSGCRINIADIPVKQEIIEICELFEENPYEAPSECARVILWDEDNVPDAYRHIIDRCTVIGLMTQEKGRILEYEDSVRYLTPPARQAADMADRKSYAKKGKEAEVKTCLDRNY
ncbi:MAG: hypothetical protein HUJ76_02395 [Parasporobacterium sp.]|nr:hypothetical protein [Parasporobacterium sp.]